MAQISGFYRLLHERRVISFLNFLLVFLLLLSILLFIRNIVGLVTPTRADSRTLVKNGPQVAAPHSLQDYAGVLKNNPFGFPGGELRPLTPAPTAGPQVSQTDLTLIGTVAGGKSYAIFSDKNGQQDVFRTGENVFGLGKLVRVEPHRVIISASQKKVEIPLTDIAKVKEIKAPPAGGAVSPFGRKMGDSSYLLDQQRIQQALEKPDQIMTDARFVPNFVEGRQQGFMLREVKPGGIYQNLGLQNGDVLMRINEFNISNPETALQAVTALRGIDRAQLDIVRNGSKMTMTYQIR